jgi:hypothetical protein
MIKERDNFAQHLVNNATIEDLFNFYLKYLKVFKSSNDLSGIECIFSDFVADLVDILKRKVFELEKNASTDEYYVSFTFEDWEKFRQFIVLSNVGSKNEET